MSADRPIVFATDYGPGTEWVGVCHAVMRRIAPRAVIIDLTHSLPRFDVHGAGLVLRDALPYTPVSVGALVVDPGVGTDRRAVGVRSGRGDLFFGPDNGLLPLALERVGGVIEARVLSAAGLALGNASTTFHGRDLFCPTAAKVTLGLTFESVGPACEASPLVRSAPALLEIGSGSLACEVTNIDGFGNVRLSATPEALSAANLAAEQSFWVRTSGGEMAAHRARTFAELGAGRLGLLVDSFGWLALCINRDSAAARLSIKRGARVELRKHSQP